MRRTPNPSDTLHRAMLWDARTVAQFHIEKRKGRRASDFREGAQFGQWIDARSRLRTYLPDCPQFIRRAVGKLIRETLAIDFDSGTGDLPKNFVISEAA